MSKNASMREIKSFGEYCKSLNALCGEMQRAHELVLRVDADRALEYAKSIDFKGAGDVLLFCAAANLMNTYVKQPGCKGFGYSFKMYVPRVIDYIHEHPEDGVRYSVQMDGKSSLAIIEVFGIQFSFHCVKSAKPCANKSAIEFDGVRKQRCATTLFKLAEANQLMRGAFREAGASSSRFREKEDHLCVYAMR